MQVLDGLESGQATTESKLEELILRILGAFGEPVDFGELLIFLEQQRVPHAIAKEAIWELIQRDLVAFNPEGSLVVAAA